jgi:translation initiation factor IF-3
VVGSKGEDLGILPVPEALELARTEKLDLVEVAPNARPPVAKIMNYGKFKFEAEKRDRDARKKQNATGLKEVKLRPKIGDHDREFKTNRGIDFLKQGNKLKVTIMFSGREMAHTEIGRELLELVKQDLLEHGKIEAPPRLEGRNLSMTIAPLASAKKAAVDKSTARKKELEGHKSKFEAKQAKAADLDDTDEDIDDTDDTDEDIDDTDDTDEDFDDTDDTDEDFDDTDDTDEKEEE